jgi:hypothetical protein
MWSGDIIAAAPTTKALAHSLLDGTEQVCSPEDHEVGNALAPDCTSLDYCTALARSRAYSSFEMVPEFFRRSSFSSSSATL